MATFLPENGSTALLYGLSNDISEYKIAAGSHKAAVRQHFIKVQLEILNKFIAKKDLTDFAHPQISKSKA